MKHQLLKLSASLLLSISLLSYTSCSDDKDENNDCGKDIYDPMENNPAKEVDWLVDMIENRSVTSGYIVLYKMDGENYYRSNFLYPYDKPSTEKAQSDILKLSVEQPPQYIYNSEGALCGSSYYDEKYKEFLDEFSRKATAIATVWKYESCK